MELKRVLERVKNGFMDQFLEVVKDYIDRHPVSRKDYHMDVRGMTYGDGHMEGLEAGIDLDYLIDGSPELGINIEFEDLRQALQEDCRMLQDAFCQQEILSATRKVKINQAEYLGLDIFKGQRHAVFRLAGVQD